MQQKVLMYGSNSTVTILSSMMQHVYRRGELKNTVKVSFGDQDSTKGKYTKLYVNVLHCVSNKFIKKRLYRIQY